jgi:hypothetical protein
MIETINYREDPFSQKYEKIYANDFKEKRKFYQTILIEECSKFLKSLGYIKEKEIINDQRENLIESDICTITLNSNLYKNKSNNEIIVESRVELEDHSDHHSKGEQNILSGFGLCFKIKGKWKSLEITFNDFNETKNEAFNKMKSYIEV